MSPRRRLRDIALLLPIGALILFLPPYIRIFSQPSFVFGVPLLHVYIFSAWLIGIVLTGLVARRFARVETWPEIDSDTGEDDDRGGKG